MISTRELAKLAGVSQATVSRCLNDRPGISAETKELVRTLAKQHGYVVRNKNKRTICTNKRKAIGVLQMSHHAFDDHFIKQLLSILYKTIEQENYYAIPLLDFCGEQGIQQLKDLIKLELVEGFIIVNREYDAKVDEYFNQIGIPHVYLIFFGRNSSEQVSLVDTDNYLGGYIASKHLLELGHRHIVALSAPWDEFHDRLAGYQKALNEYQAPFEPSYILTCDDCRYEEGYRVVTENLALFEQATAVYGMCDVLALGALNALKDHGFRIPEDISVIGYDGLDIGQLCRPELTSVAQPFQELAHFSVAKLLEISNAPKKKTIQAKTFLPPALIERQSTSRCRE
ncbi:LacI family DNA-binding transcriptional regulator [Agathobaculum sp. NTUH-O15-33]|uniref:LacI family DNA-binding transcriptional regulator n=1 Tax=Agathobaculum sp. NTUH-O15-33 TaxID=3079302 RepID=UPI002958D836|nr:LacI family DNA-binding transcriptional regulator [Agathobaculum sp. NTUH-O15-33]WNX86156.1 LacI family DNA-binding transcriptional regulator [Agathobaculum sp. NTUH-O15-33]